MSIREKADGMRLIIVTIYYTTLKYNLYFKVDSTKNSRFYLNKKVYKSFMGLN